MVIKRSLMAASAAWACTFPWRASAADCNPIVRSNVADCALAASLTVQAERQGVAVEEGRQRAVAPWLPGNPTIALSGAQRRANRESATNLYATLSQELEIAGQRDERVRAAGAAKSAQQYAVVVSAREVAAQALRSYFEVLAARGELRTATRLEETFGRVAAAMQAGAAQGLVPGVDADVAGLTVLRLTQARIAAQHRSDTALAQLSSLVGADPQAALAVEGELTPLTQASALSKAEAVAAASGRPELAQVRKTRDVHVHTSSALRRARIPTLTVSLFAQRDGFDERVVGGGVALPIPLPAPLGRTFAGELAEQAAWIRRADVELESVERATRLQAVLAWQDHDAAKAQSALYSEQEVARAEQTLASMASALSAGRLTFGSVVVAQQTLIEFLRARIASQLASCLSSVELVRVTGLPLSGGGR